jgi:hypothetical protein
MTTGDALNTMMDQMSPDNRKWVERQSGEQQRKLLGHWQEKGGSTGVGGVGTETSDVDVDTLVEEWREHPR